MTLAEIMGALLVGAMVLSAVLAIYGRTYRASQAVLDRLGRAQEAQEVLQRLAADLDRLRAVDKETRITLSAPKVDQGYEISRLEIRRTYLDGEGKEQVLESVIWQTDVDLATRRLVLYRAHLGAVQEDRLFDRERSAAEALAPFVPVCAGLSRFRIEVPQGEALIPVWQNAALPPGLHVTLSFAEPTVSPQGEVFVPEVDWVQRTIAVDRTRAIRFEVLSLEEPNDANSLPADGNAPPEPGQTPAAAGSPETANRGSDATSPSRSR